MATRAGYFFKPLVLLPLCLSLLLPGCQTAYYSTMEKFGVHKRDILIDRVNEARDSQQEAKEQFASALEKFSSVVKFKGGELEKQYQQLKNELDRSEAGAVQVHDRIKAVEEVAEDLFDEWQDELKQYTSSKLRQSSKDKLARTKKQYARLIKAMKRAEAKIEPVLNPMRDQVLYLKHNLNARAIASLENELTTIETDVARLIREMESSIREADSFIRDLKK